MGGNDGKVNGPMGGKEGKVKSGIDGKDGNVKGNDGNVKGSIDGKVIPSGKILLGEKTANSGGHAEEVSKIIRLFPSLNFFSSLSH